MTYDLQLRARGVAGASIFGSVARGEATAGSDVDVLIELDPKAQLGFSYFTLPQYFAEILEAPADVVSRRAIKPYVRERILQDAVRAF